MSSHSSSQSQACGKGSECVELGEVRPRSTTIGPCKRRVRIPASIKGHGPRLARESELLLVLVGLLIGHRGRTIGLVLIMGLGSKELRAPACFPNSKHNLSL